MGNIITIYKKDFQNPIIKAHTFASRYKPTRKQSLQKSVLSRPKKNCY